MSQDLFPHQLEGVDFIKARFRVGLLDTMGLGKTATTIRALDERGARRGVVIVKAALLRGWVGEFQEWGRLPRRVIKGKSIHDFISWRNRRADVLVTSYEMATKWHSRFMQLGEILDFIVIDEAHFLKNPEAKRTKAILGENCDGIGGVAQNSAFVPWLTGTLIPNDPIDCYTFLRFVGAIPPEFSLADFTSRYFYTAYSTFGARQTAKPEMLHELQAAIRNNSIRRSKEDVQRILGLPRLVIAPPYLIDGDDAQLRLMLAQHPGLEKAIIQAVEMGGLSNLRLTADHVATLRRLLGEAKAVPYAQLLIEEFENGLDKMVVMGVHRRALTMVRDSLVQHGVKTVLVNGDTPDKLRGYAVEAFTTDPETRCFIGNINSAGAGLNLQAQCNRIDIFESDWTPAGNAQAIMRVHRIGQKFNVLARFITLANTFDVDVNTIVRRKTAAIADVEGDAMAASAPLDSEAQVA